MRAPRGARLLLVLGLAAAPLAPAAALADPPAGLSVQGSRLLEDGAPFLPRGFTMIGLLAPDSTDGVGVTGYTVTRDATQVSATTGLGFTDVPPGPGRHTHQVTASDAAGNVSPAATATVTVPAPAPSGLTGTYFDTATLTVQKLIRIDRTVDFAWGTRSPAPGIAANTFSVRWTGQMLPNADGTWTFYTRSGDGVRLDRTGTATIKLLWSGPGTAEQVVPATRLLAG